MVDPGTRQKPSAASKDADVIARARSRRFKLDWLDIRSPRSQGAGAARSYRQFWPRDRRPSATRRTASSNSMKRGDELPSRRAADGQGLRRHQAGDLGRRQDGRPPRQQGRHRQDPARGGHAVPGGRHAGRHPAQPAGRAQPHERRPDSRDPPGLGRREARLPGGHAGVRRRRREDEIRECLEGSRPARDAARAELCTTAAPASRSSSGRRSATSTC